MQTQLRRQGKDSAAEEGILRKASGRMNWNIMSFYWESNSVGEDWDKLITVLNIMIIKIIFDFKSLQIINNKLSVKSK